MHFSLWSILDSSLVVLSVILLPILLFFFLFFFVQKFITWYSIAVCDRLSTISSLSYHRQEILSVSEKKSDLREKRTRYRLLITNLQITYPSQETYHTKNTKSNETERNEIEKLLIAYRKEKPSEILMEVQGAQQVGNSEERRQRH